jgi:hypothetical protein
VKTKVRNYSSIFLIYIICIFFLGSEGEISVISKKFDDYLWLLLQNFGPMEVYYSNEYIPKINENSKSPFS